MRGMMNKFKGGDFWLKFFNSRRADRLSMMSEMRHQLMNTYNSVKQLKNYLTAQFSANSNSLAYKEIMQTLSDAQSISDFVDAYIKKIQEKIAMQKFVGEKKPEEKQLIKALSVLDLIDALPSMKTN
jgi:hypothetical protein